MDQWLISAIIAWSLSLGKKRNLMLWEDAKDSMVTCAATQFLHTWHGQQHIICVTTPRRLNKDHCVVRLVSLRHAEVKCSIDANNTQRSKRCGCWFLPEERNHRGERLEVFFKQSNNELSQWIIHMLYVLDIDCKRVVYEMFNNKSNYTEHRSLVLERRSLLRYLHNNYQVVLTRWSANDSAHSLARTYISYAHRIIFLTFLIVFSSLSLMKFIKLK